MFGRKKRAAAVAERPQITLGEAIELAVRAQVPSSWKVAGLEVGGQEGRCTVGTNDYSFHLDLHSALHQALSLRAQLGKGYSYRFTIYGTVTRQTLSSVLAPGWRSYAQPIDHVVRTPKSIKEFRAWMDSHEGRTMRLTAWWVTAEKK